MRKNRGFLLVIALLGIALWAHPRWANLEISSLLEKPESPFLEEWLSVGQGKGFLFGHTKDPQFAGDSLTIGHLIRLRVDKDLWSDSQIRDLSRYILMQSNKHDISPFLVLSLIDVESGFRPDAVSPRGARGLMQIMPLTAEFVAQSAGMKWAGPAGLADPKVNIDLGLRYVSQLKTQFSRPEQVLTAYNMGPAALEKKLRKGESFSLEYYNRVMAAERTYRHEAQISFPKGKRRKPKWL